MAPDFVMEYMKKMMDTVNVKQEASDQIKLAKT